MHVLIYTDRYSSRLNYTAGVVFEQLLSWSYRITTDKPEYRSSRTARINYSRHPFRVTEWWIYPCGLLSEKGVSPKSPARIEIDDLPAFFQTPGGDWPFDLFGLSFYLLSRYEEYLPFEADRHGRFSASQSLAHRFGFLRQPLVDQWSRRLADRMRDRFAGLPAPSVSYSFLPTYDVDLAWAFGQRPIWRHKLAIARDLFRADWPNLKARWKYYLGQGPDPFFTFSQLERWHDELGLQPVFFWLLANPSPFDRNISHQRKKLRALIKRLADKYPVGIHPSYYANRRPHLFSLEKKRLEEIINSRVGRSRQHFLRLDIPHTYRHLLKAGIQEDFSLGYHDEVGYRAGISRPFPWYDLERDESTDLIQHPFQAMDITLKKYLKLTPESALDLLLQICNASRQVEGRFSILWHNSSFAATQSWGGWSEAYRKLLRLAI